MNAPQWIDRDLTPRLSESLRTFPVVVVTGARQVGKTSLCRHVWPDAGYVTLDIPSVADAARLSPERLLDEHPPPLIIDEIQYVPELLRAIKARVDRQRAPGSYLLTGSQDFLLMQGVTESLSGRCAILNLPPLGLCEALPPNRRGVPDVDRFLWRGGWPDLWRDGSIDRELWLGSYLATYLERDVRNTLNVASLRDFDRFLRACALRVGQLLSFADLARDVGIAPNTAKSWVSVLQASHHLLLLEPWHANATKRLIKTPKLYFTDCGLLLYLMGFRRWQDVPPNSAFGAVWENAVVAELRKALWNAGIRSPMHFWRTAAGDEVDVLVEQGPRRFLAVECKTAERLVEHDLRGLRVLEREYGRACIVQAWCACRTSKTYPLEPDGHVSAATLPVLLTEFMDRMTKG
jgi:predicted AAA+ superfamily ATPase